MSDDGEYYYDAEFEEFQDMLYDADPMPDLADDLAETATYSPIFQDYHADELRDYHSDWEYYSDDYFDDDPALLGAPGKGAGVEREKVTESKSAGQRNKRKREGTDDGPIAKRREVEALRSCFRGTVWKGTGVGLDNKVVTYEHGRDAPVSLVLSSDIMRATYGKRRGLGKGGVRFKKDDTWANDLSLEDMGLRTERSMSMPEQPEEDALSEADDEKEVVDVDDDDDVRDGEEGNIDDENGTAHEDTGQAVPQTALDLADAIVDDLLEANGNSESHEQAAGEALSAVSEKPQGVHHDTSHGASNGQTKKGTKKRKLSQSDSGPIASTAASRAKRVDSKSVGHKKSSMSVSAASTRPRRS